MEVVQIARLLNDTTTSLDGAVLHSATQALDSLSHLPHFPFSLLSISSEGENQGQRVAAATYLKNFIRRNIDSQTPNTLVSREFKDQLLRALLRADPSVLKVLVDVFRIVVDAEFVRHDSWPELVPDLRSAIQNSNLFYSGGNCQWNTINALTILHALIRPFQYFLNPKVAKEPVPPQLDLIAREILVPLLVVFNHLVEKALSSPDRVELEMEKVFLIVCKCMHFSLRSHMPSALIPHLPLFIRNLIGVLGSLRVDRVVTAEDGYLMRVKTGKRSLLIFCALITRHRKYSDKLMPDIINCVLRIVTCSSNISKLDFLSERIISLAFDVISHILETGPGWRLVSPHFSFLLDSAIFPALVLNEKDISEWEEDPEEYMRKNLPSELDEISGWREDLFTARKSAMNLLGVISVSKGPPIGKSTNGSSASSKRKKGEKNKGRNQHCYMGELIVFPFLSKFAIPSDVNLSNSSNVNNYFGVLMAYGGLQDFLRDQKPEHVINLLRTRLLPLYAIPLIPPYLVASANWVIGELASCLVEDMSEEVYSSLLKALAMPDEEDISCYPVRVSAAGAIAELLENDYPPPDWLPLLEAVISRINIEDEESCILLQLLSSVVEAGEENVANHIPFMVSSLAGVLSKHVRPNMEIWPQVVERGFVALAVMAKSWENLMPEEDEQMESNEKWTLGRDNISRALSALLQQAWLSTKHQMVQEGKTATTMCLDDSSMLLRSIMLSVTGSNVLHQLKLSELLSVWADLISDWHAWEESEDLSVFDCIKEVVSLHSKYGLKDFMSRKMQSPPAPPVAPHSIIESIGIFVSEAIFQYPSATWRACYCVHMLLHVPCYSYETEEVKQSLVTAFGRAAFSRFREIQSKPSPLWKALLLVISSCYLCCPDTLVSILEKDLVGGFTIWASSLAFVCTESFEPGLSVKSEIKLAVMTLAKVIERLLEQQSLGGILLSNCFSSLMEAVIKLKEVQDEMEEDSENEEADDNDDEEDDDEDSEGDEHEETEEEFLERYAKAAADLDDGVEEGDIDEQEHEIELGLLEEADERAVVLSLIDRYRHLLVQGHTISPQIISRFLNAFPDCNFVFQQ